jgi:uncharacterized damage-inducible protein DinB
MNATMTNPAITEWFTPTQLFRHWQGHRALTRRVIQAFPEKELFEFSIGGMRPFFELTMEMATLAAPAVEGVATGVWPAVDHTGGSKRPRTKEELLDFWDEVTEELNAKWPRIDPARFQIVDKAFGQYENTNIESILYIIDNEIHHRAQGYVYLRALGIEPPYFWER